MRYVKLVISAVFMLISVGCSSLDCKPIEGKALQGTETAVVGIYIDKNGYPQVSVDPVTVYAGQKIVFIGPDKFDIFFKDNKSPIEKSDVPSTNGIVVIEIPRDIFEREQKKQRSSAKLKELLYRYGIRANGKVTDPTIRIEPR